MSDAAKDLREFFEYIWEDTVGLVYVPTLDKRDIHQTMYEWPKQKEAVILHTLRASAEGKDAFFSPALYSQGPPKKENVLGSHVLWADFDGQTPEKFDKIPEPSLRIISSTEDRQHCYWKLDEFQTDVKKIEDSNRGIAYSHGADTSGWDATQFLRPPHTINLGYLKDRPPMKVTLGSGYGKKLSLSEFSLAPPKETVNDKIKLDAIPDMGKLVATYKWPEDMWDLYSKPVENISDRSAALQRLAYYGAEVGFSDEGIYALLHNADERWRKYADRHDQKLRLIDCINRARAKIGYNFDDDSVIDALVSSITAKEDTELEKPANVIFTLEDFLSEEYKFEWIFDGLITSKGFGIITGAPGTGKTQLLMQMAASLATGQDFFHWPIATSPKRVLFLSLEMGGGPLQLFYKKTVQAYNPAQRGLLQKNLLIAPLGFPVPLDEESGQLFIDSVMGAVHPEVVFIDSLSQVLSGSISDEIATKNLIWYLYKHIRDKYGASVVMIHHNRKESNNSVGQPSDLDDIYGNRFLTAGLDFGITLRKTHVKDELLLSHVKSRLATEYDPITIKRTEYLTYEQTDSKRATHPISARHIFGPDSGDDRNGKDPGSGFSLGVSR